MRKFYRLLFAFLFLSIIPAIAFAATAPSFDKAINYSGPLVFFWNVAGNLHAAEYTVFISTTYITPAGQDFASLQALAAGGSVIEPQVFYNGIANSTDLYLMWPSGNTGVTYYAFLGVTDQTDGSVTLAKDAGNINPIELSVTCLVEKPEVLTIDPVVDNYVTYPNDSILNFDTQTITYNMMIVGDQDAAPILNVSRVNVDIQTDNPQSIFPAGQSVPVTIDISSSDYVGSPGYAGNVFASYPWMTE